MVPIEESVATGAPLKIRECDFRACEGNKTAAFELLAYTVARGEGRVEVLRAGRADSVTARVWAPCGNTAVVKLWARTGWRATTRARVGCGPAMRERRMLRRVAAAGVRVPMVLCACRLDGRTSEFTEAIVLEDLGHTTTGLEYVKALVRTQNESARTEYEEYIIRVTKRMVLSGVLDPDHRLTNFVVTRSGERARLDLEIARSVRVPVAHPALLGRMIGTLIGSYCFAVQPQSYRVSPFAGRLVEAVQPGCRALRKTKAVVEAMLEAQRVGRRIETRVVLPW